MNLYGPRQFFSCVLYTETGAPAGNFLSLSDASMAFRALLCLRKNANICVDCSFCVDTIQFYTYAICICVGDGMFLAGLSIAPKTRSMGHSPCRPTVGFTACNDNARQCSFVALLRRSKRMRLYALIDGAWYLSIPIVPGFSMGASSNVMFLAAMFCFISSGTYDNP